jgi:LuxR family maltose regulon positive regulatory protein
LIKRLHASDGCPFVLISGPAGSGKTSLACQWLEHQDRTVAWYALDQEDNDPDSFYRYLLAAFIKTDPSLNATFGPMLGSQQQLTGNLVLSLIIESLSNAGRIAHLVLDDFHHIDNHEILDMIARLMQYMPSCLQLVVLSRHRLPAVMDIVVLKSERLKITAADLKFTDTETVNLIKNILKLPISIDRIHELHQSVEGWAAGLQLIGLEASAKGSGFNLSNLLSQAHDQIGNYLIYDILNMQPEEIRHFVSVTALLDRFNPGVCEQVTGQKNALKILARIARMNLFLISLDTDGQWYRYHHMFSEAIRRRLAIDDPALVCECLCQAARWFAANNCIEDAMRSAFRSGDMEFTADLMEEHIFQYVKELNPGAGLRWIFRLPSTILNQRVLLMLYQCHFLTILMENAKVKDILATIESCSSKRLKRYSSEKQENRTLRI